MVQRFYIRQGGAILSMVRLFDRHRFYSPSEIFSSENIATVKYKQIILKNIIFGGKDGTTNELNRQTGGWRSQEYLLIPNKLFSTLFGHIKWW